MDSLAVTAAWFKRCCPLRGEKHCTFLSAVRAELIRDITAVMVASTVAAMEAGPVPSKARAERAAAERPTCASGHPVCTIASLWRVVAVAADSSGDTVAEPEEVAAGKSLVPAVGVIAVPIILTAAVGQAADSIVVAKAVPAVRGRDTFAGLAAPKVHSGSAAPAEAVPIPRPLAVAVEEAAGTAVAVAAPVRSVQAVTAVVAVVAVDRHTSSRARR
jgi:hypothetical protein